MRKRLIWFLVSLTVILGLNILLPLMQRTSMETSSVNTSLSYSPFGYKALYLLLQQLDPKHPVTLWQHSMMNLKPEEPKTVWLVEPGKGLFFDGDKYRRHMRALVDNGYNLIFVLDGTTLDEGESLGMVSDYLERWYHIRIRTRRLHEDALNVAITDHLGGITLNSLAYKQPDPEQTKGKLWVMPHAYARPALLAFRKDSIRDGQVLLESPGGDPLVLRYRRGKGTVTIFPNGFYFGNSQLDRADNAPLALALQQLNASKNTLFEVYSSGFNENRDIVTYLATGKGFALLITAALMLICLCLWMIQQPIRRQALRNTSDEKYFTQEVFISSLARHYIETHDWNGLYRKMRDQFQREIDRRYRTLPLDDQLKRIAANPFFNVSYESLAAVFADNTHISTEKAFIGKSRHLLDVQRKVSRYEQYESRAAGAVPG